MDVNRVMMSSSKYSLQIDMTLTGQKHAKRHKFIDISDIRDGYKFAVTTSIHYI